MLSEQQCRACLVVKPAAEFAKDPRVKGGLNAQCRACFNAARRRRYAADPEAGRQRKRDWRAANPDKVVEIRRRGWEKNRETICRKSAEWYYANREQRLAVMAAYREANRDELLRLNAEWRKTPAGRAAVSAGGRRRRAAKAGLPREPYTLDEIVLRDGLDCCLCGEPITPEATDLRETLTVEHHIPLQARPESLAALGVVGHPGDVLANVGLAHYRCNAAKKHSVSAADVARYEANARRLAS